MEPSVQSPAAVRLIALPDALALQEDGDLVIPAIRGLLQGCGLEKRYAVFLLSQLRQGIPAGAQRYALFHPWGQEEADPQGFPLHIQEGDPEKECAEERLMYSFPQGQAGVALRGPLESRGKARYLSWCMERLWGGFACRISPLRGGAAICLRRQRCWPAGPLSQKCWKRLAGCACSPAAAGMWKKKGEPFGAS